jgi:hypothetical protein
MKVNREPNIVELAQPRREDHWNHLPAAVYPLPFYVDHLICASMAGENPSQQSPLSLTWARR